MQWRSIRMAIRPPPTRQSCSQRRTSFPSLRVDEKPNIQAIERASGYAETDSGQVVRGLKSSYKRHGTLNLFAALEVATGQITTKFPERKKREDLSSFCEAVLTVTHAATE